LHWQGFPTHFLDFLDEHLPSGLVLKAIGHKLRV
jgi:hypothetical protein